MFFDKLVIALISPLGTAWVLGLLALLLGGAGRRRPAFALGMASLFWIGLWSLPVASNVLVAALESTYPQKPMESIPPAQAIVVLGGAVQPPEMAGDFPDLRDGADRVWYATQLYRAGKAPLILLSGGSDPAVSATSEAAAMRLLMADFGIPDEAMLLEGESRNTRQNARFSAEILHKRDITKILLVTSALHMPRAVGLFESEGLTVIPAPTDFGTRRHFSAVDFLPQAIPLSDSSRAMKELVGRAFGR